MASDRYETARKSSPVKLDAPYSVYDPAAVASSLAPAKSDTEHFDTIRRALEEERRQRSRLEEQVSQK